MNVSKKPLVTAVGSMVELYQQAFREHGDSPASVLWPRGRQELRFEALSKHIKDGRFSVLDFGCGLGHLKDFLEQRFDDVQYYGADLVPEFISSIESKSPGVHVKLISSFEDLSDSVDHVMISGTFNIIAGEDAQSYLESVKKTLIYLFSLCRVSLSVNFMTDRVDFQQPGAHHVNVQDMYCFLSENLSRRLLVDQSYMPYEFTCTVIKDDEVVRPDNIFRAL
jgi:SAM-dependent methyltransferase